MSEASITGISMNGLGLKVGNPKAFNVLFMVTLFYFYIRYNSYLTFSNGKNTSVFREIIQKNINAQQIVDVSLLMEEEVKKSLEHHGFQYWDNELDAPIMKGLPRDIRYNTSGKDKAAVWTGFIEFPPTLNYEFGFPAWELKHYNQKNEHIYIKQKIRFVQYFNIIKAEYKAITEAPYYLDFRFPYWLFWLSILSFIISRIT